MILVIFIILLVLIIYLSTNYEKFNAYKDCSRSARINELNYEEPTDLRIRLVPVNDLPGGKANPKDNEVPLKYITVEAYDDRTNKTTKFSYYGFHPDDIKKIDPDLVDEVGTIEYVNTTKLIPLLYNDFKYVLNNNFDNPTFTKKISDQITSLENKAKPIIEWHDKESGKVYTPSDCTADDQCNGGQHLNCRDKGGRCVNNKCKCYPGFGGETCIKLIDIQASRNTENKDC